MSVLFSKLKYFLVNLQQNYTKMVKELKQSSLNDKIIMLFATAFLGIGSWVLITLIDLNSSQKETIVVLKQLSNINEEEHILFKNEIKTVTDEINTIDRRVIVLESKNVTHKNSYNN